MSEKRRKKREPHQEPGATLEVVTQAPVPPDGGWGWVVVMSSFFISIIVDGVCYTFGIFFNNFIDEFGENKSTTSWAGSVLNGTYLSVGVFVSALANRYGCRRVAIIGAFMAACSFFASTFSPNIGALIFLYGFCGGLGFGLMYLPALVMVGYYFEEKRAFATGVAVCGSGIGAFTFAPLCEYLIETYSWKGALWIISGVVANGMIFAAFYRQLDPILTIVEPSDEEILMSAVSKPIVKRHGDSHKPPNKPEDDVTKHKQFLVPEVVVTSAESSELLGDMDDTTTDERMHRSDNIGHGDGSNGVQMQSLECDTKPQQRNRAMTGPSTMWNSTHGVHDAVNKGQSYRLKADAYGLDKIDKRRQQEELLRLAKSSDSGFRHGISHNVDTSIVHGFLDVARPLYRKDIFYSGSVYHLPQYMSVSSMNDYVKSVTRSHTGLGESIKIPRRIPQDEDSKLHRCLVSLRLPKAARDILEDMLDMEILSSITFNVYALSCTLTMIGFFVPFVYLPPMAIDIGTSTQKAAFLVSVLGITNTVGRVITGLLCDRAWVDCLIVNNVGLMLAGLATLCVPVYKSYWLMATYCAFFGLCISPFVSLRTVIVVELLGLDKLSNSFGFITMFQGASSFVGVPIAGAVCDATGSYDSSFYLSGAILFLSGMICIPLRRLKIWEDNRNANRHSPSEHVEVHVYA